MINRRLIFHFYASNDWKSNPIYYVHKYFLTRYSHIFTEATFIISVNDTDDIDLINEVKSFLIECKFKTIEFRVEKNCELYEVDTFEKYILNRLNDLDGSTFFGHSKGTMDYYVHNKNAILLWITMLYFLNLEYYKEAENRFYSCSSYFFGGPMLCNVLKISNGFLYSGTFYWLNCLRIYKNFKDSIPKIYDRFYAENFPGSLCLKDNYEACSHNYKMIGQDSGEPFLFFKEGNPEFAISILLDEDEQKNFYSVVEDLKQFLSDNKITY